MAEHTSTPFTSCVYHSRQLRPVLESVFNVLKKQKLLISADTLSAKFLCACRQTPEALCDTSSALMHTELPATLKAPMETLFASSEGVVATNLAVFIDCVLASTWSALLKASRARARLAAEQGAVVVPVEALVVAPKVPVTEEFRVPLNQTDVGVFISKTGFAQFIPKRKEKINVHYQGHHDGCAVMRVTADTADAAKSVKDAICAHASRITAARHRHRVALRLWIENYAVRAERRRAHVITREQTEHRFLDRLDRSAHTSLQSTNPKVLATSHFERDRRGAKRHHRGRPNAIHHLKIAEEAECKEVTPNGVYCGNCGHEPSGTTPSASCRYHSGFATKVSEGSVRWSCCGQRFLVRGKHDKESEEESHLSTGCVAGVKHTWRIRKAEYEYHQHHHGHRQSKGDKKGAALLRDCLAENFSDLILSY